MKSKSVTELVVQVQAAMEVEMRSFVEDMQCVRQESDGANKALKEEMCRLAEVRCESKRTRLKGSNLKIRSSSLIRAGKILLRKSKRKWLI